MKKALIKDTIKEIKNTHRRFISILLMAFLGVGFFAGIRASSPDMLDTIDKYFKDENVYDIEVISTLGLTNEDIDELKKVDGVKDVYGTYAKDALIEVADTEAVAKIMCVEEVNKPSVVEGRLPENNNECVVEELFLKSTGKKIGDKITIEIEDTTDDNGDKISYLKEKEVEIVGTAKTPIYISRDKGTSKLGAGKVNYYIYINEENINAKDIYTEIYINTEDGNKYKTSTQEYEDYIAKIKENIEDIKNSREQARHDMLVEKAQEKLDEAQKTFDEQKADAEVQIAEAQKQIDDGKAELEKGEAEINKNRQKANSEFAQAQKQIDNAKSQIQSGESELNAKETEANEQMQSAQNSKAEIQSNLNMARNALAQVNANYNSINQQLKNLEGMQDAQSAKQRAELEQTKTVLENKKRELEENIAKAEAGITQIEQSIQNGKAELENAKQTLQNSKSQITAQENTLKKTKIDAYAKIQDAQTTLNIAKSELANGEAELEEKRQEVDEKLNDAEKELIDARDKIAQIENATWYILDRNTNQGYTSFIQDTKSVESIGVVFPIVFFVIATLISLTSMTRMVEEERTQIGTLKALGYTKIQVASKYLIYALSACLIGGTIGMFVGCNLLPRVIWMMYSMMYSIDIFVVKFNVIYSLIGLAAASICVVGATLYAVLKELKETPAILMRPKAPKNGKRVLLEKVPFIWKHLSFTRKVTVRNLFRYKKRFLMTIIGILGCTALIITGFGLKDSITAIIPNQFEKVFKYDIQISLKANLEEEQKNDLITELKDKNEIKDIVETNITAGNLTNGNKEEEVQIIVPKDTNELENVISLNDRKSKENVKLNDNEIMITDKLAQLTGTKVGDTIKIKDSDDKTKEFKVSNIVENYVGHYVYMSKNLYEKNYEKYETNVLYVDDEDISQEQEDLLVKEIVDKNEISSVSPTSTVMSMIDDMMNSLNYVVIILIVSAGMLAFVVLYNLSNVNISERIRELATIKVLGFYDKEVYNYISRETIILTLIGIVLGCIAGYYLNVFILGTCEINALRFAKIVNPMSYVYSILITIIFTIIVNIVTYFSLKKIDMIESLKSVE